MPQFNLYQAKAKLSALVERASGGEEIIIAKAGKPRVRLVPVRGDPARRRPGRARGRIQIAADFDAPLPTDLAAPFGAVTGRKRR